MLRILSLDPTHFFGFRSGTPLFIFVNSLSLKKFLIPNDMVKAQFFYTHSLLRFWKHHQPFLSGNSYCFLEEKFIEGSFHLCVWNQGGKMCPKSSLLGPLLVSLWMPFKKKSLFSGIKTLLFYFSEAFRSWCGKVVSFIFVILYLLWQQWKNVSQNSPFKKSLSWTLWGLNA